MEEIAQEDLNPRQRGTLVETLGSVLFHGGTALGNVPGLLKQVLETQAWRTFETSTHEIVSYDRFESFATTPPSRGLGASIDLIRRIVSADLEALDMLDQTLQNPASLHTALYNVEGISSAPTGGTTQVLRRLRKDRPDLHARVLGGELSPHAAMVEAGFRQETVSVPISDLQRTAQRLKRHLDKQQLHELAQLLSEE